MDHAPALIVFYDVPDTERDTVTEWLDRWGLGPDWDPCDENDPVEPGQAYADPEANVTIALDGTADLVERAPGSTWRLWAGAFAEGGAEVHTHVPGLPYRQTLGDGSDAEVFTAHDIRDALAADTLPELLGDAYDAAIARLTGWPAPDPDGPEFPICGFPVGGGPCGADPGHDPAHRVHP